MKNIEIVANTDELTEEEWLELRRQGIGGSEVGAILGASRWATPYSIWLEKTGQGGARFQGNEATRIGKKLERPVAELYAETTNQAVIAIPIMIRNAKRPWMLANVDFFLIGDDEPEDKYPKGQVTDVKFGEHPEITGILEIKTGGMVGRTSSEWDNDGVPTNYAAQGAHYAAVTGVTRVIFAALLGGKGLTIRERDFDPKLLEDIAASEEIFWLENVINKIAPEPTGNDIDLELIRDQYGEAQPGTSMEADDFLADTIQAYAEAKQKLDQAEQRVKELRAKIELAIGTNEQVVYAGSTILTYKANKTSETIDTKAMIADNPELAARYKTQRPGARVLRIAK